jgi:hypothetical protein
MPPGDLDATRATGPMRAARSIVMNRNRHSHWVHVARLWATAAVFVALATANKAYDEPLRMASADAADAASVTTPIGWNAYGPAGGRLQGVEIIVSPFY